MELGQNQKEEKLVDVYHFKIRNKRTGEWEVPLSKRTSKAIAGVKGVIIPGTMEKIAKSELDRYGQFFSKEDRKVKAPRRPVEPGIKGKKSG